MKIAVILPVYNGGDMLIKSVESVLSQSFKDFTFIICDDCSLKDTSFQYLETLTDHRIKLFRNTENKGLFPTLNFMIKQSEGVDLIKIWSQDDIMFPQCLEKIIAFHTQHNFVAFSYVGNETIDENDTLLVDNKIDHTPSIISPQLHTKIALQYGSIAANIANITLNKHILAQVGLFREDMKISGDFEMWSRLAAKHSIGRISEKLIYLRRHKNQLSNNARYIIYHLREDKIVFNQIIDNLQPNEQKNARNVLKWNKHIYYFTIFVKLLLKREWATAKEFYQEIRTIDNLFFLSLRWAWIKTKKLIKNPRSLLKNKYLLD